MKMQVEKFGKRLALELPDDWVERYRLREGDEIDGHIVEVALQERLAELERLRNEALARIRENPMKLPPDWKFDREEANAR